MSVEAYLRERAVEGELIRLDRETPTVELAAEALGVPTDAIIKSLLFQAKDGECVLVIASGTGRIDPKKLAAVTGKDGWRLAKPDVVLRVTGYPAGGTPPIGHGEKLRVLMDRRTAALETVYGGAGTLTSMLRIRIADIRRLTGAEVHALVVGESAIQS